MLDLSFPLFKFTFNNEKGRLFASNNMWFSVLFPKENKRFYLNFDWDLTLVSELDFLFMASNKDRIEKLERNVEGLQGNFSVMEVGMGYRLYKLE